MRTFEEAFEILTSDWDKLAENMRANGDGRVFQHEEWSECINKIAEDCAKNIATSRPDRDPILHVKSCLCAAIQRGFEFGLLIGMEMEKP